MRCAREAAAHFRVLAHAFHADLRVGHRQAGLYQIQFYSIVPYYMDTTRSGSRANTCTDLRVGRRQAGEVCPGNWIFHYFDPPTGDTGESGADDDNAHRRTTAAADDGAAAALPPHVTFIVRVMAKALFTIAASLDFPPEFNSRNGGELFLDPADHPQHIAHDHILQYNLSLCDAVDASGAAHRAYVGLYAAEFGCAIYDVAVVHHDGHCDSAGSSGGGHDRR